MTALVDAKPDGRRLCRVYQDPRPLGEITAQVLSRVRYCVTPGNYHGGYWRTDAGLRLAYATDLWEYERPLAPAPP